MATKTITEVERASNGIITVESTKMAPAEVSRKQVVLSKAAQHLLDIEAQYTVGGFTPLPGFFESGLGSQLWVSEIHSIKHCNKSLNSVQDVDGKEYLDFICMFSACNQGHCHPKIVAAMIEQVQKGKSCTAAPKRRTRLNSSAPAYIINTSTHNSKWALFAERMCKRFKYDQISAMVTGAEGADLACKIARRYAHDVKGVPGSDVLILAVSDSYHGLSSGVWNLQDPSPARTGTSRNP